MADDKFILHIGATTTDLDSALKHVNGGLSKFKSAIFSLQGAIGAIGLGTLTSQIVEANTEFQKIHYTLQAVTGSSKEANSEFDFVRRTSDALGLSLQDAAQGYARLSASAYGAGVTTKQLHTAFRGLSEAFTVLHTPAQDTQRVLLQLEQTLSKGKVQTQDLNAITNSLPKVYETAAKAFGVTGAKFQQMLQNGLIPGSEFLIKFSAQLHKEFGPTASQAVDSLNAQINLLHNALFNLETQAGSAGFVASFTQAVKSLTKALSDPSLQSGLKTLIVGLGQIIEISARGISKFAQLSADIGTMAGKIATLGDGPASGADVLSQKISHLRAQIQQLEKAINAPAFERAQIPGWSKNVEQQRAQLKDLQAQLQGYLALQKKIEHAPAVTPKTTSGSLTSGSSTSGGTSGTGGAPKTNPNQTQIESILLQLKQQASEYGKSSTAVSLYRLQLAHATPAEIKQAKALTNTIETLKRQTQQEKLAASAKQKAAQLAKQHAKSLDQEAQALKDQLDPIEPLRRELALYDELLKSGRITQDEWAAATFKVNEQMDQLNNTVAKTGKTAKKSTSEFNQFSVQAARNIQDIIAKTLESGFQSGFKGVVDNFEQMLRQMAAQAAAADLGKRLFGNMGGASSAGGSSNWGWAGEIVNLASHFFHEGGSVDAGGRIEFVPALAFASAPRLHSGGGFGLAPDEVPAILQKGEYVMSRSQIKNAGNGGVTIHAPITINTPDANSFQKAKGQIAADVSAMLDRAAQRYR